LTEAYFIYKLALLIEIEVASFKAFAKWAHVKANLGKLAEIYKLNAWFINWVNG
jgi:hypothetical protein